MASLEKYNDSEVSYELKHNTRESPFSSSNKDIDPNRTSMNYSLAPPDRGGARPMNGQAAKASKEYYNARKKQVYCYGRRDLVTACQWIVTAPQDLKAEEERLFFETVYEHLNRLYGAANSIQAIVHKDEGVKATDGTIIAGRPHLHYVFLPVVRNPSFQKANRYGNITGSALYREKLCADALINKTHLKQFHERLQKSVDEAGIHATVYSGITAGANRSIYELKNLTLREQLDMTQARLVDTEAKLQNRERELEAALNEIAELRNHIDRTKDIDSSWGISAWGETGWGKDYDFTL